ncbi:sodium:calcium symporter [Kiritimatiellaeota bacterium B1221]|nr:sodium:calcium symporter [Kiritimatiellaeota bacterium B1221]
MSSEKKESWNSRVGVILAVVGSAVGLGNFLRFPGEAVKNGGGLFMVPYIVAFLIVGIPLAWSEWALGRYGGNRGHNSAPGIFREILGSSKGAYLGMLGTIMPMLIYTYYVILEALCLYFAWGFLNGDIPRLGNDVGAVASHFLGAVGANSNGELFSGANSSMLICLIACTLINFGLIYRGLSKGIEIFCSIAMPMLVVCAFVVLIRVVTLPPNPEHPDQSFINGLGFMWNPEQTRTTEVIDLPEGELLLPESVNISESSENIHPLLVKESDHSIQVIVDHLQTSDGDSGKQIHLDYETQSGKVIGTILEASEPKTYLSTLLNPGVWVAATGQIFFSLSLGFGLILTYASYLKRDDDIALSSLTSAAGNGFCEVVLGGMIAIPAAFIFLGKGFLSDPSNVGTFGLGFVALPNVFNQMPMGQFFGFLFFFLLFLAAVTSSLSMLQPTIALLEEGLGLPRKKSVTLLGGITLLGTLFIAWFSKGFAALDTVDFWMANFFIFIFATFQTLVFGWVIGKKKGYNELCSGAEIKVPKGIMILIRYISPVYLLGIFLLWATDIMPGYIKAMAWVDGKPSVAFLSISFILIVITFFAFVVAKSNQKWRHEELEEQV